MTKPEVEVLGLDELARGSRKLADNIEASAPKAFYGVAQQVSADVRGAVPRRSGALAGSVSASLEGERAEVGMGGDGAPYAGWIEFGGSRGRPYIGEGRYLYPAAVNVEAQLIAAAEEQADDEIGGMRWESP